MTSFSGTIWICTHIAQKATNAAAIAINTPPTVLLAPLVNKGNPVIGVTEAVPEGVLEVSEAPPLISRLTSVKSTRSGILATSDNGKI
jgi:hypothetical protein